VPHHIFSGARRLGRSPKNRHRPGLPWRFNRRKEGGAATRAKSTPERPNKGATESERLAFEWAFNTVSWIYQELGRGSPRLNLKPSQLTSDARWCHLSGTGRKLVDLLRPKFLQEASDYTEGRYGQTVGGRMQKVQEACMSFAEAKYGQAFGAAVLGSSLAFAAANILWRVDVRTSVYAAHQVLKERTRAAPSQHDLNRLISLLEKFKIPRRKREAVLADAGRHLQRNDQVARLLRAFFNVNGKHWRRFLDHHGRPRQKKLPTLRDARSDLVEAFLHLPKQFYLSSTQDSEASRLSAREARDLAAQCLKAAFPDMFPQSLDGDSVKHAISYHRLVQARPPEERPRYNHW